MEPKRQKRTPEPPPSAKALLRWFCAPHWLEEIEGDLDEQFDQRLQYMHPRRARLLYWKDMLLFLRPYAVRRTPSYAQARGPIMFTHYAKVTTRNIRKQKLYGAINIFGLAVGMAVCILLFLFVRQEWRYNRFHENGDRIYRLTRTTDRERTAIVSPPLAPALQATFPEVEHIVRLDYPSLVVKRGPRTHSERAVFADPAFFEVFTFPLLQGNPAEALRDPGSVVLAATLAEKYFPGEDALGQTLSLQLGGAFQEFVVSGVAADVPETSSIRFSLVVPYARLADGRGEEVFTNWLNSFTSAFVLLQEDASANALEARLPAFTKAHFQDRFAVMRERGAQGTDEELVQIHLQPLTNIYWDADVDGSSELTGLPIFTYLLGGMAVFILLIACINFVNLAIARSATRLREIGVRQVVGALRGQLMRQFWGEALFLSAAALVVGLGLAWLSLPTFNTLAGKTLALDLYTSWTTSLTLLGLIAVVGLLAGGYPAAYLSRFRPVEVLKGTLKHRGKHRLGKALVVFQFTLSVVLIIGTILLSQQLDYLRSKDLGFRAEQVVAIATQSDDGLALMERYRQALSDQPEIVRVAGGSTPMSDWWSRRSVEIEDQKFQTFHIRGDYDFLDTFEMQLAAGRNFSRAFATDAAEAVLINEAFARRMGWEDPVGQTFDFADASVTVIGVVKDFHFISLHYPVGPLVLHLQPRNINYLFVRVGPEGVRETLALLEETWRAMVPELPFTARFLDERIAQQYETEERITRIVRYAALLAVLIACLGLFGLSALTVAHRTKEIGIRKVMGASTPRLLTRISTEFVLLVVLANVVAWPLAYLLMDQLFQFHAYRIDIGLGYFFLTGLLSIIIALLSVGYQALKAARTNPTDALRYE